MITIMFLRVSARLSCKICFFYRFANFSNIFHLKLSLSSLHHFCSWPWTIHAYLLYTSITVRM